MPLADETALGLIETHGLVAGIEAADAMLKTAEVRLVSMEQTVPALITIKIVGDVASVQASVDAGRAAAERVGRVVSAHVIPRPAAEVRAMIELDAESPPNARAGSSAHSADTRKSASAGTSIDTRAASKVGMEKGAASRPETALDEMTVPELRALARELPDFPIQGREVARARKGELIEHLKRHQSR